MTATLDEKIACLKRELKLRHQVYPRLIRKGKMTAAARDLELRVMAAILTDYLAQQPPASAGPLFEDRP